MSTADEIFASMETSDNYIVVNPETRELIIPDSEFLLGVYQDKDVERKYFKCPRYVGDDIDLSTCYIFVNYISSSGAYGQYLCDDITVENDNIVFSWLLSSNVFDLNEDSTVRFSVQAKTINTGGTIINVFNTTPITGAVYATIESGEVIETQYADVILELLSRMDNLETSTGVTNPNKKRTISLPSANWSGTDGIFSQTVEIEDVTSNSKIDLQPTPSQLRQLLLSEITLMAENQDGVVTVYAIGDMPSIDYEMQVLMTEVSPS